MLKSKSVGNNLVTAFLTWLLSFSFAISAGAQDGATLVLRSGERVSGVLTDWGDSGFFMEVGGRSRRVDTNSVAVVEFAGGAASEDVLARLRSGHQVVVLRSGQLVEGRLRDVSGTRPLRVSVDTASGLRNFNSTDVAQVFLAMPPGSPAAPPGSNAPAAVAPPRDVPTLGVRVEANQPWVDSGVMIRSGDRVAFNSRGDIMVAPGASAGVAGTSAVTGSQYPIRNASAGALIGKVGNEPPFLIGATTEPLTLFATGPLMLGINDDNFADNSGSFSVIVNVLGRPR